MADDPLIADRAGFFRASAWRYTPGALRVILAPLTELAEERATEMEVARDDLQCAFILGAPVAVVQRATARVHYLEWVASL